MTGIIRLHPTSRFSRRAVIAGAAALPFTTSACLRAQTPVASPMAQGGTYLADARDRLRDLLALVPATSLHGADPTGQLFDWVDYDAQFAALGITDPYDGQADLVSATLPLVTSDPLAPNAMIPEILDLVGFRPFDVHQVLVAGAPPDRLLLYRGGFDVASLPAVWEAGGYERRSGEHGDYWTKGEEGEMDLQDPLQRIVFAGMNNITIIDDATIACTSTLASLEPVMALLAGDGEAATGEAALGGLIDAMPPETVTAIALPGAMLRADTMVPENPGMDASTTVEELLAESDAAVGPMPEILVSLCGATAGAGAGGGTPVAAGVPDGQAFMMFLTASQDDAAAAAEIAFWRLENMQSPTTGTVYVDYFVPANSMDEAVQGDIMVVRFGGDVAAQGMWRSMIWSRDTWPFAWLPA